eukprot:TRINITY_DN1496_c0_g1_i3.p1 TRINITY_DN1496_c0_g1~~TRINITY_DN1496_c0_g1_i3.p1  ORF type:complete len:358 (+),score=137.64 TRINITY_DN1496_c0_g1_i3:282-1355(+)
MFKIDFSDMSVDIPIWELAPIDNARFGLENLEITSFEVIPIDKKEGKFFIMLVEATLGMTGFYVTFKDRFNYDFELFTVPAYSAIADIMFVPRSVVFLGVKAISVQTITDESKEELPVLDHYIEIVFTTRNFHHFELGFNISNPKDTIRVLRVHQAYSNFQIENRFRVDEKFLVLFGRRFLDSPDDGEGYIIYNRDRPSGGIPADSDNFYTVVSAFQRVPLNAAERWRQIHAIELVSFGEKHYLFVGEYYNDNKFAGYQLNETVRLRVDDIGALKDKTLKLMVSNDFSRETVEVELDIGAADRTNGGNGFSFGKFMLIVLMLGIVAAAVVLVRRYIKRKEYIETSEERLLADVAQQV